MAQAAALPRRLSTVGAQVLKAFKSKRRRPPILPLIVILFFSVLAIMPGLIAPHEPTTIALRERLTPPAWLERGTTNHLLGTDLLGRDIISRIIYGARVSLTVAFFALLVGGAIGLVIGLTSGYMGGWVDGLLMRLVDGALSIPLILIALLLAVTLGPSERNVIFVIGALIWAQYARVLRGEVLTIREREYVTAARVIGASTPRILALHIFPNIAATLIVLLTTQIGWVIIVEASLSFLGAGVPPPAPAWGSMVADGRDVTVSSWWVSFFPGMAILMMVLSFNLFGDWLRDVLDPKIRRV
ncbi:MAG: ABC transporter permease [Chloroflexi bacterium]|nr:ABC transporter permease [Chloroflexota bacterium]